MLSKLTRFASPSVQKLVEEILNSEYDVVKDNRKYDRKKISLPISISSLDGEDHEIAFSRDLSGKGICLISPSAFERETKSTLSVDFGDANGQLKELTGTCRWSLPCGERYSISCWQIEGSLDVDRIAEWDSFVHRDHRNNERIPVALPVAIHQKNDQATLQAFTRNISGTGACLVCVWPTTPGEFCLLDIVRGDGQTEEIVAECVWSRSFGNCFMSGWEFPRLDRIQKFHRSFWDTNIES